MFLRYHFIYLSPPNNKARSAQTKKRPPNMSKISLNLSITIYEKEFFVFTAKYSDYLPITEYWSITFPFRYTANPLCFCHSMKE